MGFTCIPVTQKVYQPSVPESHSTLPPIPITLPNGAGISVRDALAPEKAAYIEYANEPVISRVRYTSITVFVHWPGYAEASSLVQIPVATQKGIITRAMLASLISRQITMLLNRCSGMPCNRKYTQYQVGGLGRGGISASDVYLKGIYNTFEGVWQVDMDVYI